jgi:hypothetical protein
MKIAAVVVTVLALALWVATLWLGIHAWQFAHSDAYAMNSGPMPSYTAGNVEADGSGIYYPVILLGALAAFFSKFAWNLWRSKG